MTTKNETRGAQNANDTKRNCERDVLFECERTQNRRAGAKRNRMRTQRRLSLTASTFKELLFCVHEATCAGRRPTTYKQREREKIKQLKQFNLQCKNFLFFSLSCFVQVRHFSQRAFVQRQTFTNKNCFY